MRSTQQQHDLWVCTHQYKPRCNFLSTPSANVFILPYPGSWEAILNISITDFISASSLRYNKRWALASFLLLDWRTLASTMSGISSNAFSWGASTPEFISSRNCSAWSWTTCTGVAAPQERQVMWALVGAATALILAATIALSPHTSHSHCFPSFRAVLEHPYWSGG